MDLSKTVACTALVIMVLLTAGHALSQDQPPAMDAALKRQEAQEARQRAVEERRLTRKLLDEEISRRCVIKGVMSDAEIDACRIAYRMY